MANLPIELIDIVIDYLHNDTLSLSSLSLASRQTLPSAQFHLFNTFLFRTADYKEGYSCLVDFLSSHPGVAAHIQHLQYDGFF